MQSNTVVWRVDGKVSNVVARFGSIRCGKFKRRTMKSIASSPWNAMIDREAEVAPKSLGRIEACDG